MRRLSTSRSAGPDLIPQRRVHYKHKRQRSSSSRTAAYTLAPSWTIIVIGILVFACLWFAIPSEPKIRRVQLRDQPAYDGLARQCQARLCNAAGECSGWSVHHEHDSSSLLRSKGLYQNLAAIDVDLGCQVLLKTSQGEWMTISQGHTDCRQQQCQDITEIDLHGDLYILASQLKNLVDDPSFANREVMVAFPSSLEVETDTFDITLISQFSVNRLDTFAQVINTWEGPISIAMYLTQIEDIYKLRSYFANPANLLLYQRASVVVLKPDYSNPDRLKYPINHLRNLATSLSTTSHIFVMDADFMPSAGMYKHAKAHLLQLADSQTAVVIPCFAIRESHANEPLPNTVAELKQLLRANIAYITDPGAGHGPTLAASMMGSKNNDDDDSSDLTYEVCYESQWEPYYILSRQHAPFYDARFKNQGGDKQSHALQLNAMGYRFLVSLQTFIVHKDHSKMVWPGGGFSESQKAATSWSYFEEFMREMEALYGSNVRWPRGCRANAIGWQIQQRALLGIVAV